MTAQIAAAALVLLGLIYPAHADLKLCNRMSYVIEAALGLDVKTAGRPHVLPLRFQSDVSVDVVVRVDGGAPDRRSGTCREVTLTHSIRLGGDTHAAIVLGDDLPSGWHHVSFELPSPAVAWVHAPWIGTPSPPTAHWQQGGSE